MSANTPIEWTMRTWNPLRAARISDGGKNFEAGKLGWHCTKISPGCALCYAEGINERLGTGHPYVRTALSDIRWVLHKCGEPRKWRKSQMVFVNSMTDLFHDGVPDAYLDEIFAVMASCPRHTFQVLTKRPMRMKAYLQSLEAAAISWSDRLQRPFTAAQVLNLRHLKAHPGGMGSEAFVAKWPLPNVHLGVSAEDQQRATERIPELLQCPSAVRFVSAEPLLENVSFASATQQFYNESSGWDENPLAGIDWVIVGGESGRRTGKKAARPCDVQHILAVVDQCRAHGVPVFVKQLGTNAEDSTRRDIWCDGKHHYGDLAPEDPKVAEALSAPGYTVTNYQLWRHLAHRKGGNMMEWAPALRVREFPAKPESQR